jgi:heme exporter protein C
MSAAKPGILGTASLLLILIALYGSLVHAPPDALQGNVQRIMYLHIPTILTAYLGFGVVLVASLVFLWKRNLRDDALAHASAEIGVLFTALAIVSGAIWGKPTWGTWWTWDARLTTTAILLFIYVGYLLLRLLVEDRNQGAVYAAVLAIIGCLDIPIIHFSVYWWRTLHQPPSVFRPQAPAIARPMLSVLILSMVAFLALYAYLLSLRFQARKLEDRLFDLRRRVAEDG